MIARIMRTTTTSTLNLKPLLQSSDEDSAQDAAAAAKTGSKHNLPSKGRILDLGNGSEVMYMPRFLAYEVAWTYFDYLNKHIPWTRPTIRVFGRSSPQPRDVCCIAEEGLPNLIYSGFQPYAHSWEKFPPLKDIVAAVRLLPFTAMKSWKLFLGVASTVYYLIGSKAGVTTSVGTLMMRKCTDQLQKLPQFLSDENESSCFRGNHKRGVFKQHPRDYQHHHLCQQEMNLQAKGPRKLQTYQLGNMCSR